MGYTGGVVETATVPAPAGGLIGGGMAFSYDQEAYLLTYAEQALRSPLHARYFEYPPAAVTPYGLQCGPYKRLSPLGHREMPHTGNVGFKLSGVCTTCVPRPLFLLAAAGPGTTVLPFGGCTLLLDPVTMFTVGPTTSISPGLEAIALPIPDEPVFTGDIYFQFVYLERGQVRTTHGLIAHVR